MGVYKLEISGTTIEAKVVDNEELVNTGIKDLRSRLDSSYPIVGFDLKYTTSNYGFRFPNLLVLHVLDRCLLVQVRRMGSIPSSLLSFLSDQSICFLGLQISEKSQICRPQTPKLGGHPHNSFLETGVNIGTFAARALNERDLEGCVNLVELASKAGFPVQAQASQSAASQCPDPDPDPDWGALCFSEEEVKYALEEAHLCYEIGTKLMSTL